MSVSVVWFRQDLRVSDHPALLAAIERGSTVLCLYIWDPEGEGDWPMGAASKWWLHFALLDLAEQLKARGASLIIRKGNAASVLNDVIDRFGVDAVYWNRRYEPAITRRDAEIKEALKERGIEVDSFNGSLLFEPWEIRSKTGTAYKVYTPFSKMVLSKGMPLPKPSVEKIPGIQSSDTVEAEIKALGLLPEIQWDSDFYVEWNPTREGAETALTTFLEETVLEYDHLRDIPRLKGTSRMSPYLHFGQISPREIVARLGAKRTTEGGTVYLKELLWREFAYYVLFHFPDTPKKPLQKRFEAFEWHHDDTALEGWKRGQTGYPIVDAGMRELWATGWMHNRVRMIVGSFLVKHLLLSWSEGAQWFWDCLVDADLASNTLGWQWIGGCGADAAPYFRIFNPMTQGAKFDPDGDYVRKWVPELADLGGNYIHAPWEAPAVELRKAGVTLGVDYPRPLIDHKEGRTRALETFQRLKENSV